MYILLLQNLVAVSESIAMIIENDNSPSSVAFLKNWRSVEHNIVRARSYVGGTVCGLLACFLVGLPAGCSTSASLPLSQ